MRLERKWNQLDKEVPTLKITRSQQQYPRTGTKYSGTCRLLTAVPEHLHKPYNGRRMKLIPGSVMTDKVEGWKQAKISRIIFLI